MARVVQVARRGGNHPADHRRRHWRQHDGLQPRPRVAVSAPAGVGDPSTLVAVFTREFGGEPFGYSSYPDFVSLQEHTSPFESLGAIDDHGPASLHVGESMHSVRVASVSWDLFRVLQLEPTRGRTIGSVDIGTNPPRR
jgi:hypothetical protein